MRWNSRYIRLAMAVATLASAVTAWGQAPLPLSLDRAVEIALEPDGSARIALAQESIQQAEQQQALARASFMPNVEGTLTDRNQTVNLRTFGFDSAVQFPGFSFPGVVGPFTVFDARASLRVPVLDFTLLRRYEVSKTAVAVRKAELEVTNTEVAELVARAYLASLRADAALRSIRANVELSEALERMAISQRDAGSGTGMEVTRAQVQLANDRQRLSVAENERRASVLRLLRSMGLDLGVPVELTATLSFEPVDVSRLSQFLGTATEQRPELRAQQQREQAALRNIGVVEAERLPSISAFGDYGAIGRHNIGLARTHTVGVAVTIPVFDGGRRKARTEERHVQYRQEQLRTRDLEQEVELDVRLAVDKLESARTQVETAREGMQLAQAELEQARRRNEAGVSIPLEITDAQTRLDRARDNEISALYNYNVARLDLAAATGTLQEFVQQ